MVKMEKNSETGCCPRFDPEPWNEKEITFTDRMFVKDSVRSIFHIPVNFGSVMKRNMEKIEKEEALDRDFILLLDEKSLWGSDIYIAVDRNVPGSDVVKLSGTYLTKVFEGSYKDMGKWVKDMGSYAKSKSKAVKKMYFYYTTCPKCAKHYGKNYTVLFAQV